MECFEVMKRGVLLLISLLAGICVLAQAPADTVVYYMNSKWAKCEEHLATYFRQAYKDGDVWCVKDFYLSTRTIQMKGYFSQYKNDDFSIENGMFYYYHSNGKIKAKVRCVKGKKEGLYKSYDSTGLITDSAYYKNDMPCKFGFKWDDGILIGKAVYNDTGSGAGEEWVYYKNGILSDYWKFCSGYLMDSVSLHYYPNGNLSCKEYFDRGKLLKYACYNIDGVLTGFDCPPKEPEPLYKRDFRKAIRDMKDKIRYGAPHEIVDMIKSKQISGVILLQICIDIKGKANIAILKGVHPKLDKYIFDLLQELPGFTPARNYNRFEESCEELELPI